MSSKVQLALSVSLALIIGIIGFVGHGVHECYSNDIVIYGTIEQCIVYYNCSGKNYTIPNAHPCFEDNYRLNINRKTCKPTDCHTYQVGLVFLPLMLIAWAVAACLLCCHESDHVRDVDVDTDSEYARLIAPVPTRTGPKFGVGAGLGAGSVSIQGPGPGPDERPPSYDSIA
jgi:hypothetical protein